MAEREERIYSILYEILGVRFQLTTDNHEMKLYLEDILEKHVADDQRCSADFKLLIPFIEPMRRRYLTRTAPNEESILSEIQFSVESCPAFGWSSTAPPLIPFNIEAIDGKFYAYHAAAINAPKMGAILLLGNKGAGKSTNALALCKEQGWSLLSDETCVIRSRDLVVQALLRQPHGHIVDDQNVKRKAVLRFADNLWLKTEKESVPILACELVFVPGLVVPYIEDITDKKIAIQILTRHQLDFGGTPECARACSKALVDRLKIVQIYHGGYQSFSRVQENIVCAVKRMHE
ncbi:hypothetical protein [Pseudomonas syringae]|uniref:hypothetical protein n=1 Tax=Pseudomonas syringae TaxID=317 RepID=UPI00200B064A|nr:hypothetical protein [Pseudomonas syringae]MCK9735543.1 hypothetical protein [Pseudomonas syringae pv. syringae]MCK9750790.1 hypothetical protein [Pseudomonas syringae pv. syringae]